MGAIIRPKGGPGLVMSVDLDTASRYRQHAEELRMIAAEAVSPDIRRTLVRIAEDYERMAISLEAIDKTNKTLAARLSDEE